MPRAISLSSSSAVGSGKRRHWLAAIAILNLGACASAPAPRATVFAPEHPLHSASKARQRKVEHYVDAQALHPIPRIALPDVRVAANAHDEAITSQQAELVANHAARSVCLGLAPYAVLHHTPGPGVLDVQLVVTAIEPSSGFASGTSAVIGAVAPVPLPRVPAGLGSLAMEAELREPQLGQLALMRWARGANAITQDPKISSIGDAWQLAQRFGRDFTRTLLDTDPDRRGLQRERVTDPQIEANRTLCAQRYGKVNLVGRGASKLLPLGPGAIDPGPSSVEED